MFWLAPDDVPTLGDWFRAGGYRTYYKGKWHASHAHLDADDGDGYLLSIYDDGEPTRRTSSVIWRRTSLTVPLLGVGRPGAARARQAQHRHRQGPLHRRRDDRAAEVPRRRGQRPAVAYGLFVPQPARRLAVRRRRADPGTAVPPLDVPHAEQAPTTRKTCQPSRPASRAWSTCGARSWRRSRGLRRT